MPPAKHVYGAVHLSMGGDLRESLSLQAGEQIVLNSHLSPPRLDVPFFVLGVVLGVNPKDPSMPCTSELHP